MEETKNVAGVDLDELRKAREELNRERGIETPPPETYDRPKREPVEEPVAESTPAVEPVAEQPSQESSDDISSNLSLDDLLEDLLMDSHFDELLNRNLQEMESAEQSAPVQPTVEQQAVQPTIEPAQVVEPTPVQPAVQPVAEPVVAEPVQDDLNDDVFSNFAAFDLGGKKEAEPAAEQKPAAPAESQTIANTDFKFDEKQEYSLDELYQAVIGVPYSQSSENTEEDESEPEQEVQEETSEEIPQIEHVVQAEDENDDSEDIDDVFAKFDNYAVQTEPVAEPTIDVQEQHQERVAESEPVIEPANIEPTQIQPIEESEPVEIPVEVESAVAEEKPEAIAEVEETVSAADNLQTELVQGANVEYDPMEEKFVETSYEDESNEIPTPVGEGLIKDVEAPIIGDEVAEEPVATAPMFESSAEELTNINGIQEINTENTQVQNADTSTFEMIGSYRQLEELLGSEEEAQEILETIHEEVLQEEAEEQQPEPEPIKSKYKEIEPYRYVDLITTDSFKNSNNLSYVFGKNEEGGIVYGNLIDSYNVAIFGKETDELHNLVHSVLLSLILKNPVSDINFVICDSKSDSKFEVYNKSSYMYFNRIAKTNKEIVDSLIELSKELEERYKLFAEIGVKSIEQYNIIAKNDGLKHLPYLLTVFNNYSKSIQLTNSDKINACLFQLLKYGRMVGIYVMIVANTAISSEEINYNLPTRLSFKTDDAARSLSTLGFAGAETLQGDEDILYSSLHSDGLTHLKVAMLTKPEIELLIENIEE